MVTRKRHGARILAAELCPLVPRRLFAFLQLRIVFAMRAGRSCTDLKTAKCIMLSPHR